MNTTLAADQPDLEASGEQSSVKRLTDDPVVSVLMLTFNHESFIREAVCSVLSQDADFHFELLIGDDCSTDHTPEILEELQQRFPLVIRLMRSESNVGMAENFRRLLEAARGEYIAFCEGDDLWVDKSKLRSQKEFLDERPQFGAVHTRFCKAIYSFSHWRIGPSLSLAPPAIGCEEDAFPHLLRGNFIQTCTFFVRAGLVRDALRTNLSFNDYMVVDWPLSLYVSATAKVGFIDSPTAVYRRVPGSAMNSGTARALQIAISYLSMLEEVFHLLDVEDDLRRQSRSSVYCTILRLAVVDGDLAAFNESWSWLQRNNPDALISIRRRLMPFIIRNEPIRRSLLNVLKLLVFAYEAVLYRRIVSY